MDNNYDGRQATLTVPYMGYSRIELLEYLPTEYKWKVRILDSGKHLFVYEDEFVLD